MATNRLVEKGKVEVYANTLFDAAAQQGNEAVVEVRNQISQLMGIIYSDMDLSYALSTLDYTPEQRHELAKSVFADCNPALSEVVAVMAENGDADMLSRVYHSYERAMADKLKLCVVDVKTVVPLDDELRTLIKNKTKADLGLDAMLNESIDPSILGGIIMSANGMRIDASVISQLNHARFVLTDNDGGED